MGEIVARRYAEQRRVLLVGQAPGADGDARPLTGTMGMKLAELAGLLANPTYDAYGPKDELIGLRWDRANVLDFYPGRSGKGHAFPVERARAEAAAMWPAVETYDRVLFCGKAVKEAFTAAACDPSKEQRRMWKTMPEMSWCSFPHLTPRFAWMPHTSMIVPWWNDKANVRRAADFLQHLWAWTGGVTVLRVA